LVHRQTPARLHGNPVAQIGAEVGLRRWQPIAWVLVALRLVDAVGHREERPRIRRVVGVRASHAWRPRPRTRIPRLFERNDVIDVDARRIRPPRTVVGEIQSPAITLQSIGSTCGSVMLSRLSTWSRESQPSPSMSRQCSNADREYPAGCSRSTTIPCKTRSADPPLRTFSCGSEFDAPAADDPDSVTTTIAPFSARRHFMDETLSAPNMVRVL